MMECDKNLGCIDAPLSILGDKWSPLMLKALAEYGPLRFSQFEELLPRMSPRTLAARLKMLEHCQIIEKRSYQTTPPRSSYRLTQKGKDLEMVLVAMAEWGKKYPVIAGD